MRTSLLMITRWIGFLAAFLLVGSVVFRATVLGPGLGSMHPQEAGRLGEGAAARLRALQADAAIGLLAILAAEVGLQASLLLEAPLSYQATGARLWQFLVETTPGWSVLIKGSLALVLILPPSLNWIPPLAGGMLLSGFTLTAHAARTGPLAAAADWVHLLAAAIWIGGLASLLVVLRTGSREDRTQLTQALAPRFSTVAGVSLGVLVASGVYMTLLYIPVVRAFIDTPYGRKLLLKLLIVTPLVGLGAANRFLIVPRLTGAFHPPIRRFLRLVRGEVWLAAMVALVVAVPVTAPPASVMAPIASAAPARRHVTLSGPAGDVRVRLSLAPAAPGRNRVAVVVTDRRGRPLASPARVLLRLNRVDDPSAPVTVRLVREGRGRYAVETAALAVSGKWALRVVVRRKGRQTVAAVFPLQIGEGVR